MPRVIYFFPHNLLVPQTGAQRRGFEILSAMGDLGWEVILFSSRLSSEVPWGDRSSGRLHGHRSSRLVLHEPTRLESAYHLAGKTAYGFLKRWNQGAAGRIQTLTIGRSALCPPSMRTMFRKLVDEADPDVLFMHYAFWNGLIDHVSERNRLRIIDTHDLVTVGLRLLLALERAMPRKLDMHRIPPELIREDFYDSVPDRGPSLQVECDVYDQYDVTVAVSDEEAHIIRQHTRHTAVLTMPTTRSVVRLDNTYSGLPVFAAAANLFNIQGYYYFCRRVLPDVRASIPRFQMSVTGTVCARLTPTENIRLLGFVDRLDSIYTDAPFFVNPVYGGTGAQVKIVDAMAHGVPVVTLDRAAQGSPIRHGVNGLVAKDAREFAECIKMLWSDRTLCRRLGAAARETIADERSPARLRECLKQMLLLHQTGKQVTSTQMVSSVDAHDEVRAGCIVD